MAAAGRVAFLAEELLRWALSGAFPAAAALAAALAAAGAAVAAATAIAAAAAAAVAAAAAAAAAAGLKGTTEEEAATGTTGTEDGGPGRWELRNRRTEP